MQQGVFTQSLVHVLLSKGHSSYRLRRTKKQSTNLLGGYSVNADFSILNLVIVTKGEKDIPDLSATTVSRHLGLRRSSRIHKRFALSKEMVSANLV